MKFSHLILLAIFSSSAFAVEKANSERLDEVRQQTQQVAPYSLEQTRQMFTRTVHGGVQHVVVTTGDAEQIKLVQAHLLKMTNNFSKGDFSETERIHGSNMPGLAQLKMAKPYDIKFEYKALPDGAQIHYSTEYPLLTQALHEWFDAQASDHGDNVSQEHKQHHAKPSE